MLPVMQTVSKLSGRSFQKVFLKLIRKLSIKHYFNFSYLKVVKEQYLNELNTEHRKIMKQS